MIVHKLPRLYHGLFIFKIAGVYIYYHVLVHCTMCNVRNVMSVTKFCNVHNTR